MSNELPPLWKHQTLAVEFAKTTNELALFYEMGTGKTRVVIEILRHIYNQEKRILRTLILCPLVVQENWVAEIKKYSKIPTDKVKILDGSIVQKGKELLAHDHIAIVNYDTFSRPGFEAPAIKWSPEVLILDESHRVKSHNSKRTKSIIKLSLSMKPGTRRYLMTGTPVTNNQLDLWSQFMVLDHGKTLFNSFYAYKSNYFYDINRGKPQGRYFPNWVPKKGIDDILAEKIRIKALIAKTKDCMDLPPLVRVEVPYDLSETQKKAYKEMKNDFITYLNDKAATASLAMVKALRLQQIVSGFLKMEDGTYVRFDNPRERVLEELLEDILVDPKAKVIIWCVFHQDYDTVRNVCKRLRLGYRELHGLVPKSERASNVTAFKEEETNRVLICSPGSGGIGINIVDAKYSIWYSRNFSLEQDEQASARNYRGGSEIHDKIIRFDIVARGTIDLTIMNALKNKKNIAESILTLKDFDL